MRRHHFRSIAVLGIIGALALTGCSASDADAPGDGKPSADTDTTTGGADSEGFYFLGDKPLPEDPQRIIALWRTGSSLAELGAPVVGQLDGEFAEAELTKEQWAEYGDVVSVGSYEAIDIEEIVSLEPDLIIGMDHGGLELDYEELSELYPTAILEIAEPTDVWANYSELADLVGMTEDFETQEAELDARIADIKAKYSTTLAGLPTTVIGMMAGEIWVDTSKALTYARLSGSGFEYNAAYTDNPERYVEELTFENIPSLADQSVIFYDADVDGSASDEVQELLDEPAFQQLPAVVSGDLYPLRGSTVYTFYAANLMLDDIEAAAAALAAK